MAVTTLTRNTDLVRDTDNGTWYLQEYKLDGKGTTRVSQSYRSRDLLMTAWQNNNLKWEKWS